MKPLRSADLTSALELVAVDPLGDSRWDQWISGHPEASPFHTSGWARVLTRTYGHKPCYFSLLRRGRPVALVPVMEVNSLITGRRGVCLPFSDFCSPLLFEPVPSRLIVDVLGRMGAERGWRHAEVRGTAGLPADAPASATFHSHTLDLRAGDQAVLAGFDPSVRRALRKAQQSGVTAEWRTDERAMRVFMDLHARTRRRHGLPPQPAKFFEAIGQEFFERDRGAVALATLSGRPIAAAVFLLAGEQAVYKFGASEDRCQSVRPSNLAIWHGMRMLMAQGVSTLHFGRTTSTQHGLRRFKGGWGAVEAPLTYHSLRLPQTEWISGGGESPRQYPNVFAHLPLFLNRLLGTALYPHLD